MELCICGSKAVLKCGSCEVFLCQSHTASHVTDGEEHHLVKIKSKISIELKEKILKKITSWSHELDQSRSEICILTKSIIAHTIALSNDALGLISEYEEECKKVIKILHGDIDTEQEKQIHMFLSRELDRKKIFQELLMNSNSGIVKESQISLLKSISNNEKEVKDLKLLQATEKLVEGLENKYKMRSNKH